MDTKLRGDIAEQATILRALQQGWGVLKPVGDRLPYDLVFDVQYKLVKIQVKSAWMTRLLEITSLIIVVQRRIVGEW